MCKKIELMNTSNSPVKPVMSADRVRWRKRRLRPAQPVEEKSMLQALLEECHEAFSLEEGEHRETDLVQLPLILYRLQTAQCCDQAGYPLPRIDDLLDQLGKSRYFSALDLASGYWQPGLTISWTNLASPGTFPPSTWRLDIGKSAYTQSPRRRRRLSPIKVFTNFR